MLPRACSTRARAGLLTQVVAHKRKLAQRAQHVPPRSLGLDRFLRFGSRLIKVKPDFRAICVLLAAVCVSQRRGRRAAGAGCSQILGVDGPRRVVSVHDADLLGQL